MARGSRGRLKPIRSLEAHMENQAHRLKETQELRQKVAKIEMRCMELMQEMFAIEEVDGDTLHAQCTEQLKKLTLS